MEDQLTIVVGGQAGSEGKGAVTARLHEEGRYDFAVRVGGPNAGHTAVDKRGRAFALRQVPVAAVVDPHCDLIVAAGSEVDPRVLEAEIELLESSGYRVRNRLYVDETATLLEDKHAAAEAGISTGTTGKGIGAARAERALRSARLVGESTRAMGLWRVRDTQAILRGGMSDGARVMVEGTQGHVLGSHAGYYPFCTSGDCRAADFLAAAGLAPQEADVWVVLRTHPIRIAGNSGPLHEETTWESLGLGAEYTTVTKKVRRVGAWNWDWAQASVEANSTPTRRPRVALTFADYWWSHLAGEDGPCQRKNLPDPVRNELYTIEIRLNADVGMVGTGPSTQLLLTAEDGERA